MGEAGSGIGPVRDRWLRASVAVALLGLSVLAAACQAFRAPSMPFPSVPAQACESVLNPPGLRSPAPRIDWHVGVEIDRPQGSAILFASGSDTLLCFAERSANGSLGGIDGTSGGIRNTGPGLTLDLAMGSPKAPRPGARALIYDLRFAGFTDEELDTLAMVVGIERAAITRQTLRGGLLRLFAQVTLTAPGVPVER